VDSATAASGKFIQNPPTNAPCRVPLLARCPPILLQNPVNERHESVELGLDPRRISMRRRGRAGSSPLRFLRDNRTNRRLRGGGWAKIRQHSGPKFSSKAKARVPRTRLLCRASSQVQKLTMMYGQPPRSGAVNSSPAQWYRASSASQNTLGGTPTTGSPLWNSAQNHAQGLLSLGVHSTVRGLGRRSSASLPHSWPGLQHLVCWLTGLRRGRRFGGAVTVPVTPDGAGSCMSAATRKRGWV